MRLNFVVAPLLALLSSVTFAAPPPGPGDPLILGVRPTEAQPGQQVRILGVNFGSAPHVTINGTPASIVGQRLDTATLYVVVPTGATSGPLILTDTVAALSSNAADFTVAAGTYTPACTIAGTIRDNTTAPLANTLIEATSSSSGIFAGVGFSDVSGNYSIGLPASELHNIRLRPPQGTDLAIAVSQVSCPATLNHQFVTASVLSGRIVENQIPYDPVPNSWVYAFNAGGTFKTISDASGDFRLGLTDGTYNFFVVGPPGGRQVADFSAGLVVSGNTSMGDVALDIGWLVSGVSWHRDGPVTAPLVGTNVELSDPEGGFAGFAFSIADGSFWLAARHGTDQTLSLVAADLVSLLVPSLDVTSDVTLERTLTVYSAAAQVKPQPTIMRSLFLRLQEVQPAVFEGANLRGTSVAVRFPDGVGGWIDGVDAWVDSPRSRILTRVPAGAVTGDVYVHADGVDGIGYPLMIEPGVYDPGSYTISGTVNDGSGPVQDVGVVLLYFDCDRDHEWVVDYDVTDAGGGFSVRHATGDYLLYVIPPVATGLTTYWVELPGLTDNTVTNVILTSGNSLSGRIVDSGVGPVGAASAPIRDGPVGFYGSDAAAEDIVQADSVGLFSLYVPGSVLELFVAGPAQSRYLETTVPVGAGGDLGDIPLDSGYFLDGYIVDDFGSGLPGFEIEAYDVQDGREAGYTETVKDGWFRMALPAGTYDFNFSNHDDIQVSVPSIQGLEISSDTRLYPDLVAEPKGHIIGTVYRADGTTQVPDVEVWAFDSSSGHWAAGSNTCDDGTYGIEVPAGTYELMAWPADPCLALERFHEAYDPSDADPVFVESGLTTTGIDFTLAPGGSISGQVVDDWGVGIPGASVNVDDTDRHMHGTETGVDGSYRVDHLPVGVARRAVADHPDYPWECWDDHVNCMDYDVLPISVCGEATGIDFNMSDTPGPVSDGAYVLGIPMTASYDESSNLLNIYWQPTCNATGHAVHFGNLGQFGSYIHEVCDIGVTGTSSVTPPPGNVFFVVVGVNWPNEGSYGVTSAGIERPSWGLPCNYVQDLSHNCVP